MDTIIKNLIDTTKIVVPYVGAAAVSKSITVADVSSVLGMMAQIILLIGGIIALFKNKIKN